MGRMSDLVVTLEGYGVALGDPDPGAVCEWCAEPVPADVVAVSPLTGIQDVMCTAHLVEYAPTYAPGPPLCESCGAYPAVHECVWGCGGHGVRTGAWSNRGREYVARTCCGRRFYVTEWCDCGADGDA